MFFDDSRPDRKKRAQKQIGAAEKSRQFLTHTLPAPKRFEYLSPGEVIAGGDRTVICDVECYVNYFLVGFKCLTTNTYLFFEISPNGYFINGYAVSGSEWAQWLNFMFVRFRVVTFNGWSYDLPIIAVALQGVQPWKLKEISNQIIQEGLRPWQIERYYGAKVPQNINHIDIMEVAPLGESLKTYAGRLHCRRMQDLPYHHEAELSAEEAANVLGYNVNDLDNTATLFLELEPQVVLREALGVEYGQDLRSKSDAQVAEAIIGGELEKDGMDLSKKPTIQPGDTFKYQAPSWVNFKLPQLQEALRIMEAATFVIADSGHAITPPEIAKLKVRIGNNFYKSGNGGLHSQEKSTGFVATPEVYIIDRDVASYYPRIIINNGYFPPHLGIGFLPVYERIVKLRLMYKNNANEAKEAKDYDKARFWSEKADSLKIAINGSFGKFGSKFSILYAPKLVTQTTLTGQLGLLMQIEMGELAGFRAISANTDGVVWLVPKERKAEFDAVYKEWERLTGFETEETKYKAIYCRDVNNYIAVKEKGGDPKARFFDERLGTKTKGIYCERGSALNSVLSKNPETLIVSDAVQAFLALGIPVRDTIYQCNDIKRFVSIRKAGGGADKDGEYLGKVIRWYYSTDVSGTITRANNGDNVGKTEGAKPLMDLTDTLPNDLDYDWYYNEAINELYNLGYYKKAATAALF